LNSRPFRRTREAWPTLDAYERFEQIISLVLTALIAAVIVASVVQLAIRILILLASGVIDPADHTVFQTIFGMIVTVLIALEFNHSLVGVVKRKHGIVQVRTVILIALLALVRKFMLIEINQTDPAMVLGLAVAVLALGGVYLLLRGREEQDEQNERAATNNMPEAKR
jgi:uncharacterized membrane protein (DUF373 family)